MSASADKLNTCNIVINFFFNYILFEWWLSLWNDKYIVCSDAEYIVHELFPRSRITCKWMRTNLYRIWSRLEWSRHDPPEDRQLIHTVLKDGGNVDSIRSTQHPCRWNDQNNLLVQRYAWIYAFNLSNNFLINQ